MLLSNCPTSNTKLMDYRPQECLCAMWVPAIVYEALEL